MRLLIASSILTLSLNSVATVSDKITAGTFANRCFDQTIINETGHPFDVAISGTGWLPLKDKNGKIVYTRYGALGMNEDGFLSHRPSGLPVVISDSTGSFQIIDLRKLTSKQEIKDQDNRESKLISMDFNNDAGYLQATYSDGQTIIVAKLTLAAFENERKLKLKDKETHLFEALEGIGEIAYSELPTYPLGKIYGRWLESSVSEQYAKKCD